MRIGLVTGEFPPMEGGVGDFTDQLAWALSARDHEIHIITSVRARPPDQPKTLAYLRQPLDLGYAKVHPQIGRWRWPSLAAIADIAIRYELQIVNLQYQAAAYNMNSMALSWLPWRLRGFAPTVVTFHDLRSPYLVPKAGRLREWAVSSLAHRAAGCIATNLPDKRRLEAWGVPDVQQIPIGSNIDTYRPNHIEIEEARLHLGLTGRDVLLGYFGFLNEMKGANSLIDALAKLDSRFHLVFIGGQTGASDPNNNLSFIGGLQAQIDGLGLSGRVHWTGFLLPERVSTWLTTADMMVMPYQDGVSLRRGTLMAALVHGRPLVTTHPAEPSAEFRHGANMWLVPPGDSAALAAAIATLAADPPLRDSLGRGAAELALEFGWESIAARTAGFYAEVLGRAGQGRREAYGEQPA